jgi:xylose isomerase
MKLRMSANAVFFGRRMDRFTEYQPHRNLAEKLELIARIPGITGVELKYPVDFDQPGLIRGLLDRHGLAVSAVNVDMKDAHWFRHGAFSNRSPESRDRCVDMVARAMDHAAELGAAIVSTCPLFDGYDYPFQLDYTRAWERCVDSVQRAAAHRRDICLVLEYQAHEPHSHILVHNVGAVLHLCSEVNAPNLGANLDVGHALAAQDSPAEAACLLHRKGLLRYVHYNDNTGEGGDWDMISGTVHYWHWVELLYTLEKLGYDGWMSGDIAPKHIDPLLAYRANASMLQSMIALLERVGMETIDALVDTEGGFAEVFTRLATVMTPGGPSA